MQYNMQYARDEKSRNLFEIINRISIGLLQSTNLLYLKLILLTLVFLLNCLFVQKNLMQQQNQTLNICLLFFWLT